MNLHFFFCLAYKYKFLCFQISCQLVIHLYLQLSIRKFLSASKEIMLIYSRTFATHSSSCFTLLFYCKKQTTIDTWLLENRIDTLSNESFLSNFWCFFTLFKINFELIRQITRQGVWTEWFTNRSFYVGCLASALFSPKTLILIWSWYKL